MMCMDKKQSTLADYLTKAMQERNLSIRAFAMYTGLAHSTIRQILDGKTPDHKTLQKIADYLVVPVETLYRLAGILPKEEEHRQEIIRVIEHLMARLPESDQQEVLQIVRMKVDRQNRQSPGQ